MNIISSIAPRIFLASLLVSAAACSGPDGGSGTSEGVAKEPPSRTDPPTKDTPKDTDGNKQDSDTNPPNDAPPSGSSCNLKGTWRGPVKGVAAAVGSTLEEKVEGTGTITLDGNGGASFAIGGGSGFDVKVYTKPLGFPVDATQELSGAATCGSFDGKISANLFSVPIEGEAKCPIKEDGCEGNWEIRRVDNKKVVGKGTFSLKR
jgi:hypothetical protein